MRGRGIKIDERKTGTERQTKRDGYSKSDFIKEKNKKNLEFIVLV